MKLRREIYTVHDVATSQFWDSNVFMLVLLHARSFKSFSYSDTFLTAADTELTRVKQRPSYIDGLVSFLQLFSTGRYNPPEVSVTGTTWKPRYRISCSGLSWSGAVYTTVSVTTLAARLRPGVTWSNIPESLSNVRALLHPSKGYILSPSAVRLFIETLVLECKKGPVVYSAPHVWQGCRFNETQYTELVSEGKNSWTFRLYDHTSGSCGLHRSEQTVRVSYLDDCLTLERLAGGTYGGATSTWGPSGAQYPHPAQSYRQIIVDEVSPSPLGRMYAQGIAQNSGLTISSLTPSLFMPQSKALSRYLSEVGAYFESLVEAPEFVPAIVDAAKSLAAIDTEKNIGKFKKKIVKVDFIDNLTAAIKLAASFALLQLFVVTPAVEALADQITLACDKLNSIRGESSYSIRGKDFNSLPEGLRRLLSRVSVYTPSTYQLTFRAQIGQKVKADSVAEVLTGLLREAARRGFVPSLSTLWQLQKFTFIIDAYVPISDYIRAIEDRIFAIKSTHHYIGFTAIINLQYPDGDEIMIFMRSTASGVFLDPPNDDWKPTSGLPSVVAVPLAITYLL